MSFAPQRGERWTLLALAVGAVLAGLTIQPSGDGIPLAPLLLLAIGLFVLGIPHGCFDQEVYRLLRKRGKRRVHLVAFLVGYLLLVLLYGLLWAVSPLFGLVSFYALTWYHWGVGDRDWETFVRGQPIGRGQGWDRAVFVFVRGGLPMALPFLFHPERVEWFLQACLDLFPSAGAPHLAPAITTVGWAGSGLLLAGALFLALRQRPHWQRRETEVLGLVALFLLLPPLLAVGLYYVFWHAGRHLLRLRFSFAPEWVRERSLILLSGGMIFSATAVLISMALGLLREIDEELFLALLLVCTCCLTLPHSLVVDWLDRREVEGR
jgi:Brp/Blh family beta-carotene 15,15'-monooxygenase